MRTPPLLVIFAKLLEDNGLWSTPYVDVRMPASSGAVEIVIDGEFDALAITAALTAQGWRPNVGDYEP